MKFHGSVEELTLTPVKDEEIDSIRNNEMRIRIFGLAAVFALLALSGGLAWWAFS